jgi:hypothetical protein
MMMSKPGFYHYSGMNLEKDLLIDQVASGIEAARA